ncbi:class I SAM-dependent methyltransferase [Sphaerisporangium sp. B11E5]|uniref:class I SAM-dependent methyltransferase n=1 Tax=Sphaerisporangium sp. B11E5 TaxID=3153563 RepID=UPI00325CC8B5
MTLFTVARNAMRPAYLPTMAHKVYLRLRHGHDRERKAAEGWAGAHAQDMDAWGRRADPALWEESVAFARTLETSARPTVERVAAAGVDLGGPAGIELLYFLTRALRPAVALETGVAAGWSTAAILGGLAANGGGQLYSSDFPLFRISHPERYIGCVVPPELRDSWSLHIKGDRRNLPEILSHVPPIGLSHYDSDKTRNGREYFLHRVRPHTAPRHVLVMDDIQDNLVFREHAATYPAFRVFAYQGKYIGLTGPGLPAVERGSR